MKTRGEKRRRTGGKAAASGAVKSAKPAKSAKSPKVELNSLVGKTTAAGAEVVKGPFISEDFDGSHSRRLIIKCVQCGKPRNIATQDAHQVKFCDSKCRAANLKASKPARKVG